jgi:putative ABC transport system substrate-binding protein
MTRLLFTLTLVLAGALAHAGPAQAQIQPQAPAQETANICDQPRVEGAKEVYALLWRGPTEVEDGLLSYLREHGLKVNVTCLSADSNADNLPSMVAEAKAARPDLVYTWGTSVTRAALGEYDAVDPAQHIVEAPVVFTMVSYPVGSRIVPDFAGSGRNVTGATHTVPLPAQISAMQAYRPIKRLGVLYNPLENNSTLNVRQLKELARESDFEVIDMPVPLDAEGQPRADVLPELIADLASREPQFLYIGPDSFIGEHRDTVIGEALEHGLPAFTSTELEILRGRAMIGLVSRYYTLGRYMGYLVEQVLFDGVDPASIPIRPLSRFTYALRLSVAAELDLYPPLDVLNYALVLDRADE